MSSSKISAKHTVRGTTPSNRILHDIANCELDNLPSEIDKCHNGNTKMYQAVKFIKQKPLQNLMVYDKAG